MAKTILYMATSFDGYVAGPHDEVDWMDAYGDVEYGFEHFLATVGAIIMGRRTYDVGVEKQWFSQYDYKSPILVVSGNRPTAPSNDADFTFVTEGIEAAHIRAKETAGRKNIYIFGGANIAQQYLQAGLLDEMYIGLVPIILGDGIRLFERVGKRMKLGLIDVKRFEKDLAVVHYSVLKESTLPVYGNHEDGS